MRGPKFLKRALCVVRDAEREREREESRLLDKYVVMVGRFGGGNRCFFRPRPSELAMRSSKYRMIRCGICQRYQKAQKCAIRARGGEEREASFNVEEGCMRYAVVGVGCSSRREPGASACPGFMLNNRMKSLPCGPSMRLPAETIRYQTVLAVFLLSPPSRLGAPRPVSRLLALPGVRRVADALPGVPRVSLCLPR